MENCGNCLSPQATLDWEQQCGKQPDEMAIPLHQAVLLHGKIYVGVTVYTDQPCSTSGPLQGQSGKVYSSDTDFASWTSLPVPGDITGFGLGTYHSQLVLAGGVSTEKTVTDVWASDDGTNWQQSESLPPLSVACSMPTIINTGSPEYLLVAGGYDYYNLQPLVRVAVLMEKQWVSVQPPPKLCCILSSTIHNGNLYVGGESRSDYAVYCRLDSLLAACAQARTTGEWNSTAELWKPLNCPFSISGSASFNRQLMVFIPPVTIFAYSPLTQSWAHVGDFPKRSGFRPKCSVVIPSGECLVIGCSTVQRRFNVLKPVVTVAPYNPDSQFSLPAISKLEAAGIQLLATLEEVHQQFALSANIDVDDQYLHVTTTESNGYCLRKVFQLWLSGKSPLPPTWRSLYQVLRELNLEEMIQDIEECLTSVDSLKEVCTSVIVSALLQQRSLDPDQLHVRLPEYVPPRVKHNLTYHAKALIQHA